MTVRYAQCLFVAVSAACMCMLAQDVLLRRTDDQVRVTAPRLHFLTGKPLERMRGGAAVTYDMQLTLLGENRQSIVRQGFERFVISYDLWEEKFSATRMRTARTSAAHLTSEAAESWCLDNLAIPVGGLPEDKPIYVRLDVRAQERRDRRLTDDDETLSLSRLIELFSRAGAGPSGSQWRAESGPVLLKNVKP